MGLLLYATGNATCLGNWFVWLATLMLTLIGNWIPGSQFKDEDTGDDSYSRIYFCIEKQIYEKVQ